MSYSVFSALVCMIIFAFVAFVVSLYTPRLKVKRDYIKDKDSVFASVLKDLKDIKNDIKAKIKE